MSSASEGSARARLPTIAPRADVAATFADIPDDVLAQAAVRVRTLPLLAIAMFLVALMLLSTVSGATSRAFHQWEIAGAGIAASLAFAALVHGDRLSRRSKVEAGLWFQAVVALGVALLEMPRFVGDAWTTAGVSGLCVWQLLFPALIPVRRWKLLLASTGTTMMLPGVSKVLTLLGVPIDEPAVWVTTIPVAVCGALGTFVGSIVYDLGRKVGQARLMGSYVLKDRIGLGGMGEVWRAEHRLLMRPAAVKLIRPELVLAAGEDLDAATARFEREARATAALKSPHTVELYDYGRSEDGTFFYVMELLEGLTFRELVERYGAQPPGRVIHLLGQACASLQEAHDRGLIHRDVKAANLLTCVLGTSPDFVKVLDFGLVKSRAGGASPASSRGSISISGLHDAPSDATVAGTIRGTPETMAPETVRGDTIDHRADIYALGCVGYWLLTGHKVFEGPTMATLFQHRSAPPMAPSERLGRPLPGDLEAVILSCLSKIPCDRPQSARALADALHACADANAWTAGDAERWWRHNEPPAGAAPFPTGGPVLAPTLSLSHTLVHPDQEPPP